MPLIEIVGVTCTDLTFCIAIAYLVSETEENYTWALERLKSVLIDCEVELPSVFVSDREIALVNVIGVVFPNSAHILCTWHIKNNVLTFMQKRVKGMELEEKKSFLFDWNELVCSKNLSAYNENLQVLHEKYGNHTSLLKYIHETWLDTYKDRFVQTWTDDYKHFGNYTSNRAESAHSKLKKHLASCQCNFEQAWTKMHSLLELSFTELKASFDKSLTTVKHIFHIREFKNLRGFISIKALDLIHSELQRIQDVGEEELLCGCVVRRTHGLPCAHELARLGPGTALSLDMIDIHWTRLHLVEISGKNDVGIVEKMELLLNDVKKMETPYQMQIYKKILEVVQPRTSSLASPKSKIKTRGRERKKRANTSTKRTPSAFELVESVYSQSSSTLKKARVDKLPIRKPKKLEELTEGMRTYVHQIPLELKAFVTDIIDVRADDNCGYRCVAALLGLGESSWSQIRRELYEELYENQSLYDRVFIENGRSTNLLSSLKHEDEGFAPVEKWMSMPDVGYIIATRYNVVVFTISERLVLTIPPLKGKVPQPVQRMEIAIAFVNQDHFVQVKLEPKHPVPPIYSKWYTVRDTDASKWEYIYNDRRQAWDERNAFANWK